MKERKTLYFTIRRNKSDIWMEKLILVFLFKIRLINILKLLRYRFLEWKQNSYPSFLPSFFLSFLFFFATSGEVKLLLSSDTLIEGRKMSFVNDLTITRDGKKIYFTDSSSKWQRWDDLLLVMEGTDGGRLSMYFRSCAQWDHHSGRVASAELITSRNC